MPPTGSLSGVKVFSATRAEERNRLGERLAEWTRIHPKLNILDVHVVQSSDNAYHCLSIVVLYNRAP